MSDRDQQRPAPVAVVPVTDRMADRLRPHALALMFAAGAALALSVLVLPGSDVVDTVPWALNASLGLPAAVVLWRWGHRFSEALFHTALVGGGLLVAVGMTFGRGGSLSVAAAFFFIWVSLYVFLFFDWRIAAGHLVVDAVLLNVALSVSDVDAAAAVGLLVVGTSVVVGAVTGATRAELARLATIDHLTGLANRRRLHDALRQETARSVRTSVPYSLIALDLDAFKAVNDRDGHHAGDQLLVESARLWQCCLRPTDTLVRVGGDEFLAVLPTCDTSQAQVIAERLHAAVGASCSLGVATWEEGEDQDTVLRRADERLYQSKRRGGARITGDIAA